MCGIAGYSTLGSNQIIDPLTINSMVSLLDHRGPDDRGTITYPHVAIGNTRLSIVDLQNGHQPIQNEEDTISVVCNGEIYNAPELRDELIAKGHKFRTRSDIEVIVHLYEEDSDAFLERLNGMFALALYDHIERRLIIARDRFGVKPLFYSIFGSGIIFASEIKALKAHPSFDSTLDPEGLSVFLGLFYIPDPWTAYRNVRKMKPGHFLKIDQRGITEHVYYDFNYVAKIDIDRVEAERQTISLLDASLKRQLLSDVPIGVLLSGGLDSRAISYLAHRHIDDLSSFTISFAEKAFDEGGPAQTWAELLGTNHQPMQFSVDDFCDKYEARQNHLDEPYSLWCNVASAKMGAEINRSGYKVVLGGDGGDELFLGYPTIHAAKISQMYRMIPENIRNRLIGPAIRSLPAGHNQLPLAFKLRSFVDADDPDPIRMFFGFKEVVRYADWPTLLTPEALEQIGHIDPVIAFNQYKETIDGLDLVDGLSYLDLKVFLPGCCLTGIDNAYMENSVEVRVPFLDNDLAEFACSLPSKLRFNPIETKPILRGAIRNHLLESNETTLKSDIRRYSKVGFEIPGNAWFSVPRFRNLVEGVLSPERIEATGFFRPDSVRRILDEQLQHKKNNERVIQAIMSLVLFLERH